MAAWSAVNGGMNAYGEQLGLLAHDLRTPISCICGAAQVALESAKRGARVEEYLNQILGAARALDAMTGELLGGSEDATFDADALALELEAMLGASAKARGQRLDIDFSAVAGRRFQGDGAALCRVLANLLSNASKYTPKDGHIALTAKLTPANTPGGEAEAAFRVQDDGVGMSEEFMGQMYQPLARAPETAQIGGLGLGLCSVRRLVERMRGTIEAQSRAGSGTCFVVRVPLREVPRAASGASGGPLFGLSLLAAGDTPKQGRVLAALLSVRGARADAAQGADDAAQRAAQGGYDAVLLDLAAPGAASAAHAIRAAAGERAPLLVALADEGAPDAPDADARLPKPVDMAALCALLTGAAGGGAGPKGK